MAAPQAAPGGCLGSCDLRLLSHQPEVTAGLPVSRWRRRGAVDGFTHEKGKRGSIFYFILFFVRVISGLGRVFTQKEAELKWGNKTDLNGITGLNVGFKTPDRSEVCPGQFQNQHVSECCRDSFTFSTTGCKKLSFLPPPLVQLFFFLCYLWLICLQFNNLSPKSANVQEKSTFFF